MGSGRWMLENWMGNDCRIAAKARMGRRRRCGEPGEAQSPHSGAVSRSGSIAGKSQAAAGEEARFRGAVTRTQPFAVKSVVTIIGEHGLEARVTSPVPIRRHPSLWWIGRTISGRDRSSTPPERGITPGFKYLSGKNCIQAKSGYVFHRFAIDCEAEAPAGPAADGQPEVKTIWKRLQMKTA